MKPLFNVLAVFKNECRALPEWIDHYLSEGANRIVLVNNNSTDGWEDSCADYMNNNRVTFLEDNRKWSQVEIYDDVFFKIKQETHFLLVCDLDEFVYPQHTFKTIEEYLAFLKRINFEGCIKIPWKAFGSSGHKKHPNGGIIKNFIYRRKYKNSSHTLVKYICRNKDTLRLGCHVPVLDNGGFYDSRLGKSDNSPTLTVDEESLKCDILAMNHYQIQSEEFFRECKMTRGDALDQKSENIRDMSYFDKHDFRDIKDKRLKKLHRTRKSKGHTPREFNTIIRIINHVKKISDFRENSNFCN